MSAVLINNSTFIAAGKFDNVLLKYSGIEAKIFDCIFGKLLTKDNRPDFYYSCKRICEEKIYFTTDHCIIVVEVNDINFVYISLDNSVRAESNGFPLKKRLPNICNLFNNVKTQLKSDKFVVFFSESCRVFNDFTWLQIRKIISKLCNLQYLSEKRNNEDDNGMSFGLSCFISDNVEVENYYGVQLITELYGSVALGVQIEGKIIWSIHFPVDFENSGQNNLSYKTMIKLIEVMKKYKKSYFAFGDFNLIEDCNIFPAVQRAIKDTEYNFFLDELTYFGSFFDTIPIGNKKLKLISE